LELGQEEMRAKKTLLAWHDKLTTLTWGEIAKSLEKVADELASLYK